MPDGVVYWHAPSALPPNSLVQEVADFITPSAIYDNANLHRKKLMFVQKRQCLM